MNRRIVAAVAAVLLASVGTFVLVAYVRGAEQRALAGEEAVSVFVVKDRIAEGAPAEGIRNSVDEVKIPAKVRAEGAVEDLSALEGMVAAVDLLPGEQVVKARFLNPQAFVEQAAVQVPEGMQQVTLSLEPERAFGGQLKPGDMVGIVGTVDIDEGPATHLLLHKVLVTRVQGEPATEVQAEGETDREPAPAANFLVTLAVDAAAAERVVFAATNGSVWLTSQDETTTEDGARVWTKETIFQ